MPRPTRNGHSLAGRNRREATLSRERSPPIRLDVESLSFSVGFHKLIDGVSFSIDAGESVAILGPSGAGKSTLMKLLNGVNRDGEGRVRYQGRELAEVGRELCTSIGYVPQDDIVHASLTPAAELGFAGALRLPHLPPDQVTARVHEVLAMLELEHVKDTRIGRLSGGQRKRVSLGVELLSGPPVLFLDEPTSGLDPSLEQKMMVLFRTLARQGRTVLVTTHVMESLDEIDLALVMMRGLLIWFGPPLEALPHFGARSFADIYRRLETRAPEEWRRLYRESRHHQEYVVERLKRPVQPLLEEAPAGPPPAPEATRPAPPAPPLPPADSRSQPASPDDDLEAELEALRDEVRG